MGARKSPIGSASRVSATSSTSSTAQARPSGSRALRAHPRRRWAHRQAARDRRTSPRRIRAQQERESLLERERLARQDAERAGKIKDEFLATLSHELRTPLHAVIGWSQILKRDLSDPEKVRTAVEIIERNGRLQAQLITDLLDISRILSGNMSLDLQPVELSTVVRAAVESITPAVQAKGLDLEFDVEPLAQMVQGDAARLQQVVWNLLTNAVKFTPRGGSVCVAPPPWAVAEIRVADTGRGIEAEFLPHVFERFRQADASASRSYGGLGLGLAIVKQFVELHGGQVRAESDGVDRGATFTVLLPLQVHEIEQVILRPVHPPSGRRVAPRTPGPRVP
jgi:signal transduction histidine kinase